MPVTDLLERNHNLYMTVGAAAALCCCLNGLTCPGSES